MAVESWLPVTPRARPTDTQRAVAVVGSGATAEAVREAIAQHGHARISEPSDAEILVVVSPAFAAGDVASAAADL
ncbi:hypothetical protein C6A85_38875, partial [Mycobacterium sp. ITM-2017-0098]